jgi:hypothetical protein
MDCAHAVAAHAVHPLCEQVNRLLEKHAFDRFVEGECAHYYAAKMRRARGEHTRNAHD